jgi:hypothetical protein
MTQKPTLVGKKSLGSHCIPVLSEVQRVTVRVAFVVKTAGSDMR